jgi:hypothetical protein
MGLTLRQMGIEALRAAIVLALVFLSFAHAPAFAARADSPVGAAVAVEANWCGEAPDIDGKSHAPCNACRIGSGADLPPPCNVPLSAGVVAGVSYGAVPAVGRLAEPLARASARGPPAA